MTLVYARDALVYDPDSDSYALRGDFDPHRHLVEIEFDTAAGLVPADDTGWNDPDDPPVAHVRALDGAPIYAGHAYITERFGLTHPGAREIRVEVLEIEHTVVGIVTEAALVPGLRYPRALAERRINCSQDRIADLTAFRPGSRGSNLAASWSATGERIATRGHGVI